MTARIYKWKPIKPMLAMSMLVGMVLMTGIQAGAEVPENFMLKISRLGETLDLIDSLGSSDTETAPTAAVRDMLKGVDWIDNERSLVLSWINSGNHPFYAVLLPYGRANSEFKAAHKAVSRADYYLLSLPPGRADAISEHFEKMLAGASQEVSATTVSLRLSPHRLTAGNGDTRNSMPETFGQKTSQDQTLWFLPGAENIRHMAADFGEAAKQIDWLHVRADLNENQFNIMSDLLPVKGSKLSELLASSGLTTRLDGFRPVHDISFHTRSFDVDAALDLLKASMGPFHGKSGIDFAELAAIGGYFTGESAGGVTHADAEKDRVQVECMAVLKNHVDTEGFMEDVFLPWAEANGGDIAGFMQNPSRRRKKSIASRTPDSTVAGQRVAGLRVEIPETTVPGGRAPQENEDKTITYEFRLAVVGNLMLVSPDDVRMQEMILSVEHLRKKTSHGPMLTITADTGTYLAAMIPFIQGQSIESQSLAQDNTGSWILMAGDDRIVSRTALEAGDLRMTLAALNRLRSAKGEEGQGADTSEPMPSSASRADRPEPEPVKQALAPASEATEPAPRQMVPDATSTSKAGSPVPSPVEQVQASKPKVGPPESAPIEEQKIAQAPKATEPEPAPMEQASVPAVKADKPEPKPMKQAPASATGTGKSVSKPMKRASASTDKSEKTVTKKAKQVSTAAPKVVEPIKNNAQPATRDAGYWMEKGRLAAAYGAYESAIRYYQKALSMGTDESRVFFNTGIAYGELGDYSQALEYLNKAIQMDPGKGAYYYGRARVHLLAGSKDKAREDFNKAAGLGDLDAIQYLKRAGQ